MSTGASSREEILRRVRAATGGVSTEAASRAGWNAVPRNYKRKGDRERAFTLELLEDRLRDYEAGVSRTERNTVATSIAEVLTQRGKRRIVVPPGLPVDWLPRGFEFVADDGLSATALDGFDGVLTGSAVAIADTGTVVLQHSAGQGRRAVTLVPDYHLCVVRVEDVVMTVAEAMERLRGMERRATTFISGPSATADIEMTRIKGVHGPRYLDVLIVF